MASGDKDKADGPPRRRGRPKTLDFAATEVTPVPQTSAGETPKLEPVAEPVAEAARVEIAETTKDTAIEAKAEFAKPQPLSVEPIKGEPEPTGAHRPDPETLSMSPAATSGSGFGRLVAASLVGAVLTGAGGYVAGVFPQGQSVDTAAIERRVEALDRRLAQVPAASPDLSHLAARLEASEAARAALEVRLAAIEGRPAPAQAAPSVPVDVAPLRVEIGALRQAIEATRAAIPPPVAAPDPAEADRRIAAVLEAALAEPTRRLIEAEHRLAAIASEARAVSAAAAANAQRLAAMGDSARALDTFAPRLAIIEAGHVEARDAGRRAALALAAETLRAAVARGVPFGRELAAAKALGASAERVAALEFFAEGGLPPVSGLAPLLTRAIPGIIAATRSAPSGEGGVMERIAANARGLVSVRPVGEAQGDDPAAILARGEARLLRGDLAGALAELNKLPEPAKAAAAATVQTIARRGRADEAARLLATETVAALAPTR